MIINDDSGFVIKLSFKLIDAVRGIIYNRHMFIVQATEYNIYFSHLLHTVYDHNLPQEKLVENGTSMQVMVDLV